MIAETIGVIGACSSAAPAAIGHESLTRKEPDRSIPTIPGTVAYSDGSAAAGATIVFTELASGTQVAIAVADRNGKFNAPVAPGDYALAISAEHGSIWIEKQPILTEELVIRLSGECNVVTGRIVARTPQGVQVNFGRRTFFTGDTFIVDARVDGTFSLCLPAGEYIAFLTGGMISLGVGIIAPSKSPVLLNGYLADDIRSAPHFSGTVRHDFDRMVTDILQSGARLVGLGEATHGGAEFVAMRAKLLFELARRADLRLVLLENDAIAASALDRYVNGEDVDLPAAISKLGFWMTDTYEFKHFIEDVRTYNLGLASKSERIRLYGIDVQNTQLPVELLLGNSRTLQLSDAEQDVLRSVANNRAKVVKQFTREQRAVLDVLLSRLSVPAGSAELHTQLAVAARSMAIQVGYMDGDTQALYAERREAGMAHLARFIMDRNRTARAALWAHDDHVAKNSDGKDSLGKKLSNELAGRYYAVGYFLFQGSSRAWDAAGKVGVVSHVVASAPPFTVEGALMAATGRPDVAWLPLRHLPGALRAWLEKPRFVREMGAIYNGEEHSMVLWDIASAFDALVVIRNVRDSSPTPTGVRRASDSG
jgi:erythromycin esterase